MTYVNLLALLGAAAYLTACLRLYLASFKPWTGILAGTLLLSILTSSWITAPGLGIIRLLLVSGVLYHFCSWNRPDGSWLPHGLFVSLLLIASALTRSEIGYLLFPWFLLASLGWVFAWRQGRTRHPIYPSTPYNPSLPVFRKATLAGCIALGVCLAIQFLVPGKGTRMLIDPSPGQSFYALTYPEPHWLGDRATVVVKPQFREMDYWKAGWQNLQSHPHKAWQNWRANVNRMVFDFPYSFSTGQPAAVGTGNGAFGMAGLFLLYALCVMAFWQARHSLPAELRLLLAWTLAGLGVRSLLSAGAEAVLPWIPSLVLTIYLTLSHILKIKIRRQDLAPPVAMG